MLVPPGKAIQRPESCEGDERMAISASFKQQCPSCEAMVPIRDPGLIGRKIDCPKCKYRFVVEEPPPDEEEDEAPARKKGPAKPTAKGPSKVTAGKPGARRPAGDEDEDDDRPAAKKKGS